MANTKYQIPTVSSLYVAPEESVVGDEWCKLPERLVTTTDRGALASRLLERYPDLGSVPLYILTSETGAEIMKVKNFIFSQFMSPMQNFIARPGFSQITIKKNFLGLTLIEIILAMFLIAVVFAALAAIYPAVYRHSTISKNRLLGMQVAHNVIESLRAVPWGKPVPDFIKKEQKFDQLIEGVKTSVTYQIAKIEFDPPNSTNDGPDPKSIVCNVKVTVKWTEGAGGASEARTQTISASGTLSKN